jgi:hypothetical protein
MLYPIRLRELTLVLLLMFVPVSKGTLSNSYRNEPFKFQFSVN